MCLSRNHSSGIHIATRYKHDNTFIYACKIIRWTQTFCFVFVLIQRVVFLVEESYIILCILFCPSEIFNHAEYYRTCKFFISTHLRIQVLKKYSLMRVALAIIIINNLLKKIDCSTTFEIVFQRGITLLWIRYLVCMESQHSYITLLSSHKKH